jgi:hypothetical protein
MRDETTITSAGTAVAPAGLLDRWAAHDWHDGLRLTELLPLDRVIVRTLNSTYEIVVMTPATADIAVRGGAFFASLTRARLAGSSLGGSFLKLHSIHVGFRMEIVADAQPIITSPVQTIEIARDSAIM